MRFADDVGIVPQSQRTNIYMELFSDQLFLVLKCSQPHFRRVQFQSS